MTEIDEVHHDDEPAPVETKKETGAKKSTPAKDGKPAVKKKKRPIWLYGLGGFLFLLILFVWWGMQPLQGTRHYGICKTFVETQIPYPSTTDNVIDPCYLHCKI